eukprot:gene13329-biopygen3500
MGKRARKRNARGKTLARGNARAKKKPRAQKNASAALYNGSLKRFAPLGMAHSFRRVGDKVCEAVCQVFGCGWQLTQENKATRVHWHIPNVCRGFLVHLRHHILLLL